MYGLTKLLELFIGIFVFVLVTDPSNRLFHMKDIAFGFVVIFSLIKYKNVISKYYKIPLLFIFILLYSFLSGNIGGESIDIGYLLFICKGAVVWLLLMWINKYHFIEFLAFPLIVLSVFTIVLLYALIITKEGAFLAESLKAVDLLYMYGWRSFIGIEFACVFFKTTPLFIIAFSVYTYKLFFQKKEIKVFIVWLLFLIPLLFAGTRACILSALGIVAFFILSKFRQKPIGKFVSNALFLFCCIGGVVLIKMLLDDDGGGDGYTSTNIKMGHLSSYIQLFQEKPYILLTGQGVGAIFYTMGRDAFTYLTEWSYMELLRNFGVIGAIMVAAIYFYPLYLLWKDRNKRSYAKPLFMGYLFYLLIAGTNPLLLGSTGYLAMLVAYSYSTNRDYIDVNCRIVNVKNE